MREFDVADAADGVNREWALSRDKIATCVDKQLLQEKEDRYAELTTVIATMLQFPGEPVDRDWFARARGALINYRVAKNRVEKRLRQLDRATSFQQRVAKAAVRLVERDVS